MSGFLGEEQVRRVKERTDLVQLMGEYTPLQKSGSNFKACCLFHSERTASMYIYPEQQTYHCFGCRAHGDAITLIRERERLEFTEAVELLARRAGIVLTYEGENAGKRSQRDRLLPVVEFATAFYERQLWESPAASEARDYLERRRFTEATIKRFRLGWAPGSGALVAEARRKGVALELLQLADLAMERHGSLGDRFFERVTFPIHDRFGHPVAFSARLLPSAEARNKEAGRSVGKYVNCTDTPLYHKGSVVFNLHHARTAVRERHRIIVMEGPTDVMAADQAGVAECVAILGTALTPDHARQLGNLVGAEGRLLLLLDGDRAGIENGLKGVRTCMSVGIPVRAATLPEELDPAELLVEGGHGDGVAVFERVLGEARSDLDHLLRALAPRPYDLDHQRRLAVADDILSVLRSMPDADLRALHLRDCADYFGIPVAQLEARLAGLKAARSAATAAPAPAAATTQPLPPIEDTILHILAKETPLRAFAADDLALEPSDFPPPWQGVAFALLQERLDTQALLALPEVGNDPVVRASAYRWVSTELIDRPVAIGDARACLIEHVSLIRRRQLQDELLRLSRELADASARGDLAAMGRLMRERLELERRIADARGLSGGPAS